MLDKNNMDIPKCWRINYHDSSNDSSDDSDTGSSSNEYSNYSSEKSN